MEKIHNLLQRLLGLILSCDIIGFNCRYLLDALRAIPDAECSLELVNGLSPIVMNPCDGSGRYSYMVLPVRLKAGE